MNRRTLLRTATALGAAGLATGVPATPAGASTPPAGAPASTAGASAAVGTAAKSGSGSDGPLRVQVVLFEGVEELDFAAPYEVLSASDHFTARDVEVRYVALGGPRTITAAFGTTLRAGHRWAPEEADLLVVPGGGYARRDDPGVWAEIRRGALPRALAAARRPGLTIAGLCTGVMLLSAAGLTRGRPCTTHHRAQSDLAEQGGVLKKARVVDDGDLVTAGGVTSGLDLALWLVRRELGVDAALGLEAMLEYEARGTVWTG
ncbi:DJ-1/PfpI family protein [Streptomyces roseolus]|uniref:DJ-1/PfpI family protein n=1 Tax=Streptomyces roseolus TaxID=67358 RepID=UPI0037002995